MDREKLEGAPLVTAALIVRDYPHLLSISLDSIISQTSRSFEIILIEVNLTEDVHQILESYKDHEITVYSEKTQNIAHLMNVAIEKSRGEYLHFFYPGDQYLWKGALALVAEAISSNHPDLFCCSQIDREKGLPSAVNDMFTEKALRKGKMQARINACWFSKKMLGQVGSFNTKYRYRAGFDMILRIFAKKEAKIVHNNRVFVDYEYRRAKPPIVFRYTAETFGLVRKYFGLFCAITWWFTRTSKPVSRMGRALRRIFWHA